MAPNYFWKNSLNFGLHPWCTMKVKFLGQWRVARRRICSRLTQRHSAAVFSREDRVRWISDITYVRRIESTKPCWRQFFFYLWSWHDLRRKNRRYGFVGFDVLFIVKWHIYKGNDILVMNIRDQFKEIWSNTSEAFRHSTFYYIIVGSISLLFLHIIGFVTILQEINNMCHKNICVFGVPN